MLKKYLEFFLNLIYPPRCGICDEINKNYLCKKCELQLKEKTNFYPIKCKNKYYKEYLFLFRYKDLIRQIILKYKFGSSPYIYKTLVKFILSDNRIINFFKQYELIIAVPIHKKRLNQRGYNQSYLITKEISKELKIQCNNSILIKIRNNQAQSTLNKTQRLTNPKNAYKLINENLIKNKKILIVDDIYTTGATLNECSKLLKKAGAKNIGIFTLAKD